MTTVGETNPATSAPQPQADKSTTASATAAADFKNFLTLLTAQLRHQDRLSPLDSTQFVQQLASFSAVEQQIETNKLLREFMGDFAQSTLESAALWIGKEVEAATAEARFDGEPLEFEIPSGPAGATGEIVVRDASGSVVYREKVVAGQTDFTWNGDDENGDGLASGSYKFGVEYVMDGETAGTDLLISRSRVAEVRLSDGAAQLVLDSGAVVSPDDIIALREASDVLTGDV